MTSPRLPDLWYEILKNASQKAYNFLFEISLILLILNFIPILIINIKFRYNFFSIFTQPFGISIMLILGISSWKNMKFGNGLTWKDRTYD